MCPIHIYQSRHWVRMAEAVGIRPKFALKTVKERAKIIENAAPDLALKQQTFWGPASFVKEIQKVITKQTRRVFDL